MVETANANVISLSQVFVFFVELLAVCLAALYFHLQQYKYNNGHTLLTKEYAIATVFSSVLVFGAMALFFLHVYLGLTSLVGIITANMADPSFQPKALLMFRE